MTDYTKLAEDAMDGTTERAFQAEFEDFCERLLIAGVRLSEMEEWIREAFVQWDALGWAEEQVGDRL